MRRLGNTLDVQQFYPKEMDIAAMDMTPSEITLRIYVRSQCCTCPKCGHRSNHRHGTYERKIQDLPILNKRTTLHVNAYEYYCDNQECEVTTFAEHVNGFLSHYGRMSSRLEDLILTIAPQTRVDEATHKPVAVLDGTTLKEWLRKNKQVTTITRDRAGAYAGAIEEVLPDCMQVADRFHLHQNLMEAVSKILGREIPSTIAVPSDDE
ncbi:MAG: transposase family protein, partial [Lachnospiraceae bacterium]|nr:transposase family protein [Lachnospiraceae bacterium]